MINSEEKKKITKGGRPPKYSEELKRRSVTSTDSSWEQLLSLSRRLDCLTRSDLVEKIGRGELVVLPPSDTIDSWEIPVYPRLRDNLGDEQDQTYSFYIRSILSLLRNIDEIMRITDSSQEREELVIDVALKAMTAIALRDFVYPDELVTNVKADTLWVAFHMMLSNKNIDCSGRDFVNLQHNENINPILWRIFNAFCLLEQNYPSLYSIFRMRSLEGLTWSQIQRLLALRGDNRSEEQVRADLRSALAKIREIWHWNEEIASEQPLEGDEATRLMAELRLADDEGEDILAQAQAYYDLFRSLRDSRKEAADYEEKLWQLETFLFHSRFCPKLDTFLCELNHVFGHELYPEKEEYHCIQSKAIQSLNQNFDRYLMEKLNFLKKKLTLCGFKRDSLKKTLMEMLKEELGIRLPPQDFLKQKIEPSLSLRKQKALCLIQSK